MPLFYVAVTIALLNLAALRRGWVAVDKWTRPAGLLIVLVWHVTTINQIGWQAGLDGGLPWFAAGFAALLVADLLVLSPRLQDARMLLALRSVAYLAYAAGFGAFPFREYAVIPNLILAVLVVLASGRVFLRVANKRRGRQGLLFAYFFVVALMLYSGLAAFTIREWTEWHAGLAAAGVMALVLYEILAAEAGGVESPDLRRRILSLSGQTLLALAVILHSIFLSQL